MNELAQARAALRRDRPSEALVFLWNAVEPARLAGDASGLRTIGGLAERIARTGDEGERREAERLLEEVRDVARHEAAVPATAQVGADVSVGGDAVRPNGTAGGRLEELGEDHDLEAEPETPETSRRAAIMNVIWLLLVLGVVALNVLRGAGD